MNNFIKLQMYISSDISNNNILSQKKDKNPDDCVDLISRKLHNYARERK